MPERAHFQNIGVSGNLTDGHDETYAKAPAAESVDDVSNDCLGLLEVEESLLGRGSLVPLDSPQPFLPDSPFFFDRFDGSSRLSRESSSSSSSQGAGEWKRILGPYILIRGTSSSPSSSGDESSPSCILP